MNAGMPLPDNARLLYLPQGFCPALLPADRQLETGRRKSVLLTFWDSFEWGIWLSGQLLYSCGDQYTLCNRDNGWPGATCCREKPDGRPRFWHDFGSAELRQRLKELLGLRGLSAVSQGHFSHQQCLLRNDLDKIVCRISWLTVSTASQTPTELVSACQVLPLAGYEPEAQLLVEQLLSLGACADGPGPVDLLLQHDGRQPRRYSLRPCFELRPEMPTREALNRIVRRMLLLAEENLPGILEDRDTEFLHDYRICLRKIRSLLSLLKDIYPQEALSAVRNRLGEEARRTNRLRDLDVYLLSRDEYAALLPPALRFGLDGMFDDFARERRHELKRIVSRLRQPSHRRLLRELADFFDDRADHPATVAAESPVGPLVFRAICKRYKKICRLAQGVTADTPDETLHRLRIECKKLRYLLEFFSELVAAGDCEAVLKQLRRLQTQLGAFNDSSVQQQALLRYQEQAAQQHGLPSLALGGLITALYQLQQQSRSKISRCLNEFCSMATELHIRRVFKPSRKVCL